jgi:hypothetical protein
MKRVKYTNTGVTPLSVIRTSDKGHYIFDDTKNGTLSIFVIRVRNHSKKESAKCKVYFDNKTIIIERSKESILAEISNIYLAYMLLFTDRKELFYKLFTKVPVQNLMLDGYIGICVISKLRKDGTINE